MQLQLSEDMVDGYSRTFLDQFLHKTPTRYDLWFSHYLAKGLIPIYKLYDSESSIKAKEM